MSATLTIPSPSPQWQELNKWLRSGNDAKLDSKLQVGGAGKLDLEKGTKVKQRSHAGGTQGAVLSTAVGLLNLFPIPALDGGHLVFYAYEAVTGKPPSDGALRILMTIGLTLVLGLMVFALGNDLFCP